MSKGGEKGGEDGGQQTEKKGKKRGKKKRTVALVCRGGEGLDIGGEATRAWRKDCAVLRGRKKKKRGENGLVRGVGRGGRRWSTERKKRSCYIPRGEGGKKKGG